jgi:hypothetical protein
MSRLEWLSDDARVVVEPQSPKDCPGASRIDDRRVILHVLRSDYLWSDYPPALGPPTIYNRYNRWSVQGVWSRPLGLGRCREYPR